MLKFHLTPFPSLESPLWRQHELVPRDRLVLFLAEWFYEVIPQGNGFRWAAWCSPWETHESPKAFAAAEEVLDSLCAFHHQRVMISAIREIIECRPVFNDEQWSRILQAAEEDGEEVNKELCEAASEATTPTP